MPLGSVRKHALLSSPAEPLSSMARKGEGKGIQGARSRLLPLDSLPSLRSPGMTARPRTGELMIEVAGIMSVSAKPAVAQLPGWAE